MEELQPGEKMRSESSQSHGTSADDFTLKRGKFLEGEEPAAFAKIRRRMFLWLHNKLVLFKGRTNLMEEQSSHVNLSYGKYNRGFVDIGNAVRLMFTSLECIA